MLVSERPLPGGHELFLKIRELGDKFQAAPVRIFRSRFSISRGSDVALFCNWVGFAQFPDTWPRFLNSFFPSMRWAKSCQQKHLEASSLNASSCEVQAEFKIKNQMIQSSDIKWYQWAETAASSSYRQAGCVPLREGRVRSLLPNLWWMMATSTVELLMLLSLVMRCNLDHLRWQKSLGFLSIWEHCFLTKSYKSLQHITTQTITISAVKASFFFGAVWVWFKQTQSGWGDVHPGDLQRNTPWANCATGHSFFTDPQDHRALPDFLMSVCLNDWLLTLGKRMQKVSAWGPPVSCFNFGDLFHIVDRNDDIVLMVAIVQTLQPT